MKLPMQNVQPVLVPLNKKTMNQNPTFNFEINLEEANVILAALQELPAKLCNPLSDKIKAQAQEQIAALQAATQEPEVENTAE